MLGRRRRRVALVSPGILFRRRTLNAAFGDDRFWQLLFYLMQTRRVARQFVGKKPQTVSIDKLKPGQTVQISAIAPPSRRSRRGRPR